MGMDTRNEWEKFLAGHWQRERPTTPGLYATATRDGLLSSTVGVYKTTDGRIGLSMEWLGWFWSEPWPDLPLPPPWIHDHE